MLDVLGRGCRAVLAASLLAVPSVATADVWTGNPGGCVPAPGDYDGDGATDLAQLCQGAWHFYNPDGSYKKGIWVGDDAGNVAVPADYDGDGKDDVVVFRNGAWLRYDYTTGNFVSGVYTGPSTGKPVPGDYDGNGAAEYATYLAGAWQFYASDGSFVKGIWVGAGAGDRPVPGDYSGGGKDEVVVFRPDAGGGGAWLFFDYTSAALSKAVFTGAVSFNGEPLQAAPVDYDGDGTVDFTLFAGGPWHFFNDDGSYRGGVWVGSQAGARALSKAVQQ
jgi:hypothetical protein